MAMALNKATTLRQTLLLGMTMSCVVLTRNLVKLPLAMVLRVTWETLEILPVMIIVLVR